MHKNGDEEEEEALGHTHTYRTIYKRGTHILYIVENCRVVERLLHHRALSISKPLPENTHTLHTFRKFQEFEKKNSKKKSEKSQRMISLKPATSSTTTPGRTHTT